MIFRWEEKIRECTIGVLVFPSRWLDLSKALFKALDGGMMDGRSCVCPHLHIGSPQGHAVGGQPKDDDDDVERGLEKLVYFTVHVTEGDVAHCPAWNTLLRFCACKVFSPSQLWFPSWNFIIFQVQQFDKRMAILASSGTALLSDIQDQSCHFQAISLILL